MAAKSILVVDENYASRVFLANHLKEKQFAILEAPTGREGLILAWQHEPDLILFDPVLSDIPATDFIQKLRADPRTARSKLVALSSDPGPDRQKACLAAGVHEYVVKSPQAIPALDGILAGLTTAEIAAQDPHTDGTARGTLVVFLSAKGGTGTSSLCANLGMIVQHSQPEARVLVADLVLPIGSIGPIVGSDDPLNLVTAAELPPAQASADFFHDRLPRPGAWEFQVLTGSPDPHQGNRLHGDSIRRLVDVFGTAYDFILLDLGRSLSRISLPLIQKADLIVLIVSSDQSTIRLTKTVYEYLQSQGITRERVYTILNRAVGLEGLTKAQAEEIIGLPIRTTMPYMGGNFALANNLNQPIPVKYPTDTASIILKGAADEIIKLTRRLRGGTGTA